MSARTADANVTSKRPRDDDTVDDGPAFKRLCAAVRLEAFIDKVMLLTDGDFSRDFVEQTIDAHKGNVDRMFAALWRVAKERRGAKGTAAPPARHSPVVLGQHGRFEYIDVSNTPQFKAKLDAFKLNFLAKAQRTMALPDIRPSHWQTLRSFVIKAKKDAFSPCSMTELDNMVSDVDRILRVYDDVCPH